MKKSYEILVCRGPECGERRSAGVIYVRFREVVAALSLGESVSVGRQSCFGRCRRGPNVLVREVEPGAVRKPTRFAFAALLSRSGTATLYNHVRIGHVERIVDEHVIAGRVVSELIGRSTAELTALSAPVQARVPQAPAVRQSAAVSPDVTPPSAEGAAAMADRGDDGDLSPE